LNALTRVAVFAAPASLDQGLHARVLEGAALAEHVEVVDHLLRRHPPDQRREYRRRHALDQPDRDAERDLVRGDQLRLLVRGFGLRQRLQPGELRPGRRVLVEQHRLRPRARLDVQERVQPLQRLAGGERGRVEPVGVGLPLAQVPGDLGLQRPRQVAEQPELVHQRDGATFSQLRLARLLPLRRLLVDLRLERLRGHVVRLLIDRDRHVLLAAVDEVDDAADLVRRQVAEHREADVAVAREVGQRERDDEHLLVVADVAVVAVPRGEAHVEPRVLFHQLGVQRVDEAQLAVRAGEQAVEHRQPQIDFTLRRGHHITSGRATGAPNENGR
jgi:hypothetical protein